MMSNPACSAIAKERRSSASRILGTRPCVMAAGHSIRRPPAGRCPAWRGPCQSVGRVSEPPARQRPHPRTCDRARGERPPLSRREAAAWPTPWLSLPKGGSGRDRHARVLVPTHHGPRSDAADRSTGWGRSSHGVCGRFAQPSAEISASAGRRYRRVCSVTTRRACGSCTIRLSARNARRPCSGRPGPRTRHPRSSAGSRPRSSSSRAPAVRSLDGFLGSEMSSSTYTKRPPGRSTRNTSARFAGAVMAVTAENSPSPNGSSAELASTSRAVPAASRSASRCSASRSMVRRRIEADDPAHVRRLGRQERPGAATDVQQLVLGLQGQHARRRPRTRPRGRSAGTSRTPSPPAR